MTTPVHEINEPNFLDQVVTEDSIAGRPARGQQLHLDTNSIPQASFTDPSPSARREHALRLDDDLAVLEAERVVSNTQRSEGPSLQRSRSRPSEAVDEFDVATNPLHETAAIYNPPENPSTSLAKIFKRIHQSSFLVRYFFYISPVTLIILIPLLLGAFVFKTANVGGVSMLWFCIWLEIFWLTLWAGRVRFLFVCRCGCS
jgi:hypothetical protein